ncbi:MAG: DUF6265 family protein [Flavobacteriales bacterium]
MKITISSLLVITLCFCTSKTKTINELEWLVGTRSMEQNGQVIYESWNKINDQLLSGKSFFVENNDTTVLETIEIKIIDNETFYCPAVVNQNDGEAVLFKLTSNNPSQLVFENNQHDFPNKICYNREGKNINAWIEGSDKKIPFYMKALTY